jgi:biotin carboxylase
MHLLLFASVTGYQIRAFQRAAERLGYQVTLATDRCKNLDDPWADHAIPVKFHDPVTYREKLAEAHASRGPFTAVAAAGDTPVLLAAMFAERVNLPFHSPAAVEATRNKFLMKERFRAAGLPLPWYERFGLSEKASEVAAKVPYPCVLKPLGLSGSRGVIRANNAAEFTAAFQRIARIMDDPELKRRREERSLLVEGFIPGEEVAMEGIVTNGRLKLLAVFDKPDPLDGPYFEETIYVTPSRKSAAEQQAIRKTLEHAVRALGLTQGPVHAEARVNAGGVWMLEVAARPIGGLCAAALAFTGGIPLEELILRHACGEDVSAIDREPQASGVMMAPVPRAGVLRRVHGVEEALAVPYITDVKITAKQGQRLMTYPEANSYVGFLFAKAATPEQAERALRECHAKLHFEILEVLL